MRESERESRALEETLARPEVHDKWEDDFRTEENVRFYDAAMELIASRVDPSVRPKLLDAGCGACDYTIRLARRGFSVTAADFSPSVLVNARSNLERAGVADRVELACENLLGLTFPDSTFDAVVCWGVLMHIPDVETAVGELARVVKPGGMLVISETNMRSLESRMLRLLRKLVSRRVARERTTAAGFERWTMGEAGELVTRECDISWLVRTLASHGLKLRWRVAGQFSESYVRTKSPLAKRTIHAFNNFWFHRVRWAGPAMANIVGFERGPA